jgi:hypothetical protein
LSKGNFPTVRVSLRNLTIRQLCVLFICLLAFSSVAMAAYLNAGEGQNIGLRARTSSETARTEQYGLSLTPDSSHCLVQGNYFYNNKAEAIYNKGKGNHIEDDNFGYVTYTAP